MFDFQFPSFLLIKFIMQINGWGFSYSNSALYIIQFNSIATSKWFWPNCVLVNWITQLKPLLSSLFKMSGCQLTCQNREKFESVSFKLVFCSFWLLSDSIMANFLNLLNVFYLEVLTKKNYPFKNVLAHFYHIHSPEIEFQTKETILNKLGKGNCKKKVKNLA